MEQSIEVGSIWNDKSGESYEAGDILAAYEQGLRNGKWEAEQGNKDDSYYAAGYKTATEKHEKIISKLEKENEKQYAKGKTDGYGEGYQHGFTVAKEKITELDKSDLQKQYNKGFEKGSDYVREYTKQNELLQNNREEGIQKLSFNDGYQVGKKEGYESGYADCSQKLYSIFGESELEIEKDSYQEGYAQAYSELHAPTTERERQLQEKAWDEGYKSAIEDYLTQGDEFVSNKDYYEFGAVTDWEHTPNKETQEVMQEVLDKDSNEFASIWVAKDGSGKLKVLSVDEGYCDVELVEDVSDAFLCTGGTVTISVDDLKEHWNKERAECNYIATEEEQLEKELALVKKYPHYYKDIRHLNILDIYRFFDLFEVTDPCLQHSMKKLAVGGKRGAKDYEKDIKEAMDTLKRWEYMQEENKRGLDD